MVCIGFVLCLPFGVAAQEVQDWHYAPSGAKPVLQPRFYNEPWPETIDGQWHEGPWLQPKGPQVQANARSRPSIVMADTVRTYYFPRFKTVYSRSDDTSRFRKTRSYTVERLRPEDPRKVYLLNQAGDTIEKSIKYYRRSVVPFSSQQFYLPDSASYITSFDSNTLALKREEKRRTYFSASQRQDSIVRTVFAVGQDLTKDLTVNYYKTATGLELDSSVGYYYKAGILVRRVSERYTRTVVSNTGYSENTRFTITYNSPAWSISSILGDKSQERAVFTGGRGKWIRSYFWRYNTQFGFVLQTILTKRWPDSLKIYDYTTSSTAFSNTSPSNYPYKYSKSESVTISDTIINFSYDSSSGGNNNHFRNKDYQPDNYYRYTYSEYLDSVLLKRRPDKPAYTRLFEYNPEWLRFFNEGSEYSSVQMLGANADTMAKEQVWYSYTPDRKPKRKENWYRERRVATQPLVVRYHGITIYEGPYDTYFLLSATKQLGNGKQLIAWPNPASAGGILHLNLPAGLASLPYTLCNVQGATVQSGSLSSGTNNAIVMPTYAGLYLLQVQGHQSLNVLVQ